jgi:hypothetical protein
MVKVQILTQCEQCNGQAYLPAGETESCTGEKYTRHEPCSKCQGSARQTKWVTLAEFVALLEAVTCQHQHTSTWGSFHFSAGDVWDDLVSVTHFISPFSKWAVLDSNQRPLRCQRNALTN